MTQKNRALAAKVERAARERVEYMEAETRREEIRESFIGKRIGLSNDDIAALSAAYLSSRHITKCGRHITKSRRDAVIKASVAATCRAYNYR